MTYDEEMLAQLTQVIHTLSCTKEHEEQMESLLKPRSPQMCYFYLEASLASPEDKLDTAIWQNKAEELCKLVGVTPAELLRLLSSLLDIRHKLDTLLTRHPNAEGFCHLVLFDEPLSTD